MQTATKTKTPKTTKTKTPKTTTTKTPRYTCCIAAYCEPGGDPAKIVRMTATVVECGGDYDDEIVDHVEYWGERVTAEADAQCTRSTSWRSGGLSRIRHPDT